MALNVHRNHKFIRDGEKGGRGYGGRGKREIIIIHIVKLSPPE